MENAMQGSVKNRREIPAKPENKIKEVVKMQDGSLLLRFHNGKTGTIDKDEKMIQAFCIFSMLQDAV